MKEVNQLDRAALKVDFKNMYRDIGVTGTLQVLYEILLSANILLEVMNEESKNVK